MNPRGKQFALGGTLQGWCRLPVDPGRRQRTTLRRVYRGWEPRVYSRYGVRPWAAPLPWVRVIVKDPFALLSLGAVTHVTGARPVVVFRHPAALLASYRRMGWRPDVEEIRALGMHGDHDDDGPGAGAPAAWADADLADEVDAMGWFWATCYHRVLCDLDSIPGALIVDHGRLAASGRPAMLALVGALGLRDRGEDPAASRTSRQPREEHSARPRLHHLDRAPEDVAAQWRRHVEPAEVARLETLSRPVLSALIGKAAPCRDGQDAEAGR